MILEIIWTIITTFIIILSLNIWTITNYFSIWKENMNKNKQFVLLKKDFSNNVSQNKLVSLLNNKDDFLNLSNNISFINNRNKVNFLSLDIWELKWSFWIYLEYWKKWRTSILWIVCKNNDKSSDYQFSNLTNKISILQENLNINLDNQKFYYNNWDCFYIQLAPEEITTDNINKNKNLWKELFFTSNKWIKNVSILLYFQKTKINDPTDNYIIWTWDNWYYEWIRYIIKKSSNNDKLELRNFYIVFWWERYWIWNNFLESLTFQTPMIFYTR